MKVVLQLGKAAEQNGIDRAVVEAEVLDMCMLQR